MRLPTEGGATQQNPGHIAERGQCERRARRHYITRARRHHITSQRRAPDAAHTKKRKEKKRRTQTRPSHVKERRSHTQKRNKMEEEKRDEQRDGTRPHTDQRHPHTKPSSHAQNHQGTAQMESVFSGVEGRKERMPSSSLFQKERMPS